ncbi:hypothetical protein L611_000300000510 [Aminobacter sp. J15]|nr:hypothetical protein L610_000900001120 [Aminobacter sp. J44]TWH30756.1 hypothetical protein L611_000300000510 [Aminobacter sp. J15]
MDRVMVRQRRIAARLSPFLATLALTAAAFLLPPADDGKSANVAADAIRLAATYIPADAAPVPAGQH